MGVNFIIAGITEIFNGYATTKSFKNLETMFLSKIDCTTS